MVFVYYGVSNLAIKVFGRDRDLNLTQKIDPDIDPEIDLVNPRPAMILTALTT